MKLDPRLRRVIDWLRAHSTKLTILMLVVVLGVAGVMAGWAAGLGVGGSAVLGTMAASASYIAAPAAVRTGLPDADPALALGASLGVTFPFNLVIGIPAWVAVATAVGGPETCRPTRPGGSRSSSRRRWNGG